LGIIGAGRAAQSLHVPALLRLGDRISVKAVADLDPERARAVCSRFGGARVCASVDDLIAAPGVEAVAILTPPDTHFRSAVRALRAGKHVFIEKPLAVSPEEAGVLVRTAREAGRSVAAGHNLRFHRLVRRAARVVRSGLLGRLVEIQMTWSSPPYEESGWRRDFEQGGVVFDLGIHHVDLARVLTGSEFDEPSIRAIVNHGETHVSAELANGARFTAVWSSQSRAAHAIRLIGTEGAAEFAMYSAVSWRLSKATRFGRGRELACDTVSAVWNAGRGGDSTESYRLEWIDFARAVRDGARPECSAEEAAKAVAVCSAIRVRARVLEPAPEDRTKPALSVVLGVRQDFAGVRRTVRHLRAQTIRERIELILPWACVNGDTPPASELGGFFAWRFQPIPPGSSVAAANATGVRLASAPVVAFAEDHCFPEPGWAEALVGAHARGYAAVGPEIANANPGSIVSWCDYLIGYGPWMSPAVASEAPFIAGHNSSYKRDILLAYGDRLESLLESETVLHFDLARNGHRLFVEPRARAAHLNFALWRVWLPVQFHCGRLFGGSRSVGWTPARRVLFAAASPLIPAVRLLRIARELLKPNRPAHRLPGLLPALAIGLICDGAGQFVGHLAGPGQSPKRLADFEYDRVRYIRAEDRRALEEVDAHAGS
jgi:predicted dehydrogenase